ncbi:MAG: hypothetical protein ACM3WP_25640 [Acidobacteriota bacterium]
MKLLGKISAVLLFVVAASLLMWSQESAPAQGREQATGEQQVDTATRYEPSQSSDTHGEDQMQVPPPVAVESYPMTFTSEGRSNYLRYGMSFSTGYMDHVQGYGVLGGSDESYSLAPLISIDTKTPRFQLVATYAPGFTFYQHTSALNESDHNASLKFKYRLSPHVTFTAEDAFVKSSNIFNQQNLGPAVSVSGGAAESTSLFVIAPVADRFSNSGSAGLNYQFSLNGMIGATGTFTYLDYPNPSQVQGLYNSRSVAGSAFYTHRISKMHYVGATYQHQLLLAYPVEGQSKTQTDALLLFYTLYPTSHVSVSIFGGPQYSDTFSPAFLLGTESQNMSSWNPAAGVSLNWQGKLISIALSYSHLISPGWGLSGAVLADQGNAAVRRQLSRNLSASVDVGYGRTREINSSLSGSSNGDSLFGTVSLQRPLGQHLGVQLGYSRLHQNYSQVTALAATPNTNRVFVAFSYQFLRPLGR